jgi:hypothetical protein
VRAGVFVQWETASRCKAGTCVGGSSTGGTSAGTVGCPAGRPFSAGRIRSSLLNPPVPNGPIPSVRFCGGLLKGNQATLLRCSRGFSDDRD